MKKILVVDDEEPMRNLLRDLLSGSYEVSLAENGRKALTLLAGNTFDLLITDVMMPELDGVELVTNIRAKNIDLKIIAISGGDKTGVFDFLPIVKLLGADITFNKPFDINEVKTTVNMLLA